MDRNELSLEPCHLGVPSGASNAIFEPMLCLAQTVHLSCLKISTISKWTKTSFHLSLVTSEYHQVCLNRFLSLWYVWCKPCTYLTLTLTSSPSGLIQDSTWPISPMYVWRKPCTYLVSRLELSLNAPNRPLLEHHHVGEPSSASKTTFEPMVCLPQAEHLSCQKISTISKQTETASTWASSPRSTIGCVQNEF
jgi:hypothetical protein